MITLHPEPNALSDTINDAFIDARRRDVFGHRAHVAAALLYLGCLALDAAPASISMAVLTIVAMLRLPWTWRLYQFMFHDRVGWLLAAWASLHLASLAWCPDWRMGLGEVKAFRIVITTLLLWPVIDYVAWMIAAFLIGVAVQNILQLGQALTWVSRELGDGPRLRGLIHPIQTATLCLMAMWLHLSAVVNCHGWIRWVSLAGLIVAGIGLIATGSRGPWIGAAITVPLAVVSMAIRRPHTRQPLAWVIASLAFGAVCVWPHVGELVLTRVEMAKAEVQLIRKGDYSGDVGKRLARWQDAWNMFLEKPLLGQGVGGYGIRAAQSDPADVLTHRIHAHSIYLHTLATTGAVGALLLMTWIVCALARAWRSRSDHPFADGIVFSLIAWLSCGIFDATHLSGEMLGVLVSMIALCIPIRPAARPLLGTSSTPIAEKYNSS